MSILSSPNIVTNGLTFKYDMNNKNSYRSPVSQNILTQIEPRDLSVSSFYSFTTGTEQVYIPTLGWINDCKYVDMYNDYNGGSNSCCPSPFGYGQGLTVSGSTEYTYAIVYKSVNGYTHPNYMYHYEFNGGTYLTEYGVFYSNGTYSGQVRNLGDDWYWASAKFTTQSTCNLINTGSWMYEYGRYNRFYVAKVMLIQGDYTNMHPRLWPSLATTVSNTQSIFDLTNNNTITATSLTYASDGTFSFNGSTDKITFSTSTLISGLEDHTIIAAIKVNTNSTDFIFGNYGLGNSGGLEYYVYQSKLNHYISGNVQSDTTISPNQWYIVAVTRNGNVITHYLNGIPDGSSTNSASIVTNHPFTIGNGHDYTSEAFGGNIGFIYVYNRALTASEVLQNFNAQRGLYGL